MTIVWVQSVSCAGVITAGYNNLVNWPSSINRPAFNGTDTITWIGPTGGGPSTANDTAQSQILTPASSVTSSADGQIIEGLNITGEAFLGNLVINNNNVIVRKCRIRAYTGGFGFGNTVDWNGSNGLIEDCFIDANSTQSPVTNAQNGIEPGAGGLTIRRCTIINAENHITSGVGMTVIDNWCHQASGVDADMVEQNGGAQNNLIQHNTFDGADNVCTLLNSGVNLSNLGPGDVTAQVTNNAFINMPHTQINDDAQQGGGGTVVFSAVNNGFFNPGGALRLNKTTTCSPNSGNFFMATVTATSGTLVSSGTGIL